MLGVNLLREEDSSSEDSPESSLDSEEDSGSSSFCFLDLAICSLFLKQGTVEGPGVESGVLSNLGIL